MPRFRLTIPVKVSFLVLSSVFVSVVAFSTYIFFKVKQDEEKAYAQTVSTLGLIMGEQLWHLQEEIKKDMTNILALVTPTNPNRNADSIRIILQKNPQLLYFELSRIPLNTKGHQELVAIFNENAMTQKAIDRRELFSQIEKDIDEFSLRTGDDINYHFKNLPSHFPIYIFEVDIKERIYATFALSKDVFSRVYNPTSPVEVLLLNSNLDVLFSSQGNGEFPRHAYVKTIESRSVNQGLTEKFQESKSSEEFAAHYYRAADGVFLITYKNLITAGLDKKTLARDVLYFFGVISVIMVLISFVFSRPLSNRLKKLMGFTEHIAAGKYDISLDIRARDEVSELAQQFRLLGERLGEKDTHMERVTEMAVRDGLTGVYNHRYFHEKIAELFKSTERSTQPLSLLLLDIDKYKSFNDLYGHQQGDIVIQQLAHLLLTLTRKNDIVARYGGDEFAILLVNTDAARARQISERIREAFEQKKISRLSGEGSLNGTCSIGVATFEGGNFNDIEEFIRKADENLYTAKRNGRNQVCADS